MTLFHRNNSRFCNVSKFLFILFMTLPLQIHADSPKVTSQNNQQKESRVKTPHIGIAPFIGLTKIISHPSLNKIEKGIMDTIQKEFPDARFTRTDAQGNITIAAQIAQKYAAESFDLIIPITTPSTQTMFKALQDSPVPLLFAAVTDPVGANLLKSMDDQQPGLMGVVDQPPVEKALDLMKHIIDDLTTIGVIFNAGEANSEYQIRTLRKAAKKVGIKVVEVPVAKASDVQLATKSIMDDVDCIFLPNDNLVISSLEGILKVANAHKKLVFVSDPESIERGAFAAVAFDQYKIGVRTGEIAVAVLKGNPAPTLTLMTDPEIFINEDLAIKKGLRARVNPFLKQNLNEKVESH